MQIEIKVQKSGLSELPRYMTEEAAGADIHAANTTPITLSPGERALIPTGLVFEIPRGYEVQIRPRSGLALRHGVTVLNTPGTIDSDYRGEIGILLINLGNTPFSIEQGTRIAQAVVAPVVQARYTEQETLQETQRGSGGFGHTGVEA
ncbi:dUTP diphosphatase [Chitinivibrio alkaliphilus]|uniref:Deoxyuridine 5'-triphosphate nucleotidohydrolase n=1 Tax=Chitinivibrio alkaliphilus ACht1 TaxID=1313304 RepID=U7D8D3_9BACT|nr:dUTP diphosphatase [Chitinivibrio alkaliphilus]ERP31327.1 deoxyuridine 5'-triphosphate nucleotidohydrolase [Chitinivibrio alkaliphilus ACht1]